MSRMKPLALDTDSMSVSEMERWGQDLTGLQAGINWWLGDLARAAKSKLGEENYSQAFPPEVSPGLIQRCEAVARAYPREEDRNPLASWSQHMTVAGKPDRIALVAAMVEAGQTSDESRKAAQERPESDRKPWCLAIDVNFHLHKFWFSGAGVEAAVGVASWIQRAVERLKEKGLTDCVCCFDSRINNRKELTAGPEWEGERYKDRPPKDMELVQQIQLVHELLKGHSFACFSVDGYEADDCLASIAKQFQGRATILSQDKDCRQSLSETVNMLLDIEWVQDETSGEHLPNYKWLSAKQHTEETGIPPNQWVQFQALAGDSADGIKGATSIGKTGATSVIKEFGTVAAAIQAAKDNDERLISMTRGKLMAKSLLEFEAKAEITLQLVTLKTDLPIPTATRI